MQNELAPHDDSYSSQMQLPFGVGFYGSLFDILWENNNGNATFDGPSSTITRSGSPTRLHRSLRPSSRTWTRGARDFSGFFAPVDQAAILNKTKAAQAVPTKFSLGADYRLDILQTDSPTSIATNCTTGAPVNEVEAFTTAGASALSCDAVTGTCSYVSKIAPSCSDCRKFRLTLDDGSIHIVELMFR